MQISEVSVKVCRVVRPCQSVNARCSLLLDIKEGPPQDVDADVMQERCQFLLLVPGYSSSYAGLRLCHGFPTLRPDRALQFRIPLGPIVSLHQLAVDRSALFAGFAGTIDESDFFVPFIIGYGLRPSRCGPGDGFPRAKRRSPGSRTRDVRTCSGSKDDAGWPRSSR